MAREKTSLENARELASHGFNILPARHRGKMPSMKWAPYQAERSDGRLSLWFGSGQFNYFIVTGQISRIVVLDCDNQAAEDYWRAKIGPDLDRTTAARTSKGHHFYFRLAEGEAYPSWSQHPTDTTDLSFDVRGDGAGVIAPPSVHETGHVYTWLDDRGPSAMLPLPDALRPDVVAATAEADGIASPTNVRSMLDGLLSNPPKGPNSGRNEWLSKVAGHHAKTYRAMRDLYERMCRQMGNDLLDPPLADDEFYKTINSIWDKEQRKDTQTLELAEADGLGESEVDDYKARYSSWGSSPNPDNGFLVPGYRCILVQTRKADPNGGGNSVDIEPWADFNIRAIGVIDEPDGERVYDVEIDRQRRGDIRNAQLPSRVLSDPRQLSAWLSQHGVTILPPDSVWPRSGTANSRLQRYLEAQEPPSFASVSALGWDETARGFVTHEGVLRADGPRPHEGVKPDPKLRNWAPHRYGLVGVPEARAVLREVLTFHDDAVCAVFGSWWAACLVKPQLSAATSLFPFMALEAPSESGKSSGFFSLMLQLNGNTQGNVNPTWAALRDYLSAHHSGIVWVDDLNDPERLMELLRQATGEGAVAKKGEDRSRQESVSLTAPICLSGESLGLGGQKALLDRAVQVTVPSPIGRMSRHNPDRPQWDDILEVKERYGDDLSQVAGTCVVLALQALEKLSTDAGSLRKAVAHLAPAQSGRWGEKISTVRFGARLLDQMCDSGTEWADRVDAWCRTQTSTGSHNTFTNLMVPAALRYFNTDAPVKDERWGFSPVFTDGMGTVWVNVQALADWWSYVRHGRIELRTQSAAALSQQMDAMGSEVGRSKVVRVHYPAARSDAAAYGPVVPNLGRRFRPLSVALSESVQEAAAAASTGDVSSEGRQETLGVLQEPGQPVTRGQAPAGSKSDITPEEASLELVMTWTTP